MNNKGFMMAEVVVVSAIVLVTLVGLYTSYNKIFSIYNQRVNYYDVATLYELGNYRDNQLDGVSTSKITPIYDHNGKIIYFINVLDIGSMEVTNQTFKDYVSFLKTSVDFDNLKINDKKVNKILIMEKCMDVDDCKYAYLEVADETA